MTEAGEKKSFILLKNVDIHMKSHATPDFSLPDTICQFITTVLAENSDLTLASWEKSGERVTSSEDHEYLQQTPTTGQSLRYLTPGQSDWPNSEATSIEAYARTCVKMIFKFTIYAQWRFKATRCYCFFNNKIWFQSPSAMISDPTWLCTVDSSELVTVHTWRKVYHAVKTPDSRRPTWQYEDIIISDSHSSVICTGVIGCWDDRYYGKWCSVWEKVTLSSLLSPSPFARPPLPLPSSFSTRRVHLSSLTRPCVCLSWFLPRLRGQPPPTHEKTSSCGSAAFYRWDEVEKHSFRVYGLDPSENTRTQTKMLLSKMCQLASQENYKDLFKV